MDDKVRDKIFTTFKEEYKKKAAMEIKGVPGWFMRVGRNLNENLNKWEHAKPQSWKFPAVMFPLALLPFYALLGGFLAAPLVTAGLLVAATGAAIHTVSRINRITRAALDRDIDSGLLTERYRVEKLEPYINALEKEKSTLPAPGVVTAQFASALEPVPAGHLPSQAIPTRWQP